MSIILYTSVLWEKSESGTMKEKRRKKEWNKGYTVITAVKGFTV